MYPTYDNLFVTQVEPKKQTASGIILATDVETGMKPAVILAKGPEAGCEIGLKCYIPWDKAKAVTHDGTQGAIISEKEILAFIDD
jgi:co-chaperonin GroES (HSP10)